jgi:hypothetical protein
VAVCPAAVDIDDIADDQKDNVDNSIDNDSKDDKSWKRFFVHKYNLLA